MSKPSLVADLFNEVAQLSSANKKIARIKEFVADLKQEDTSGDMLDVVKHVLILACDPDIRFGITAAKVEKPVLMGDRAFDMEAVSCLEAIRAEPSFNRKAEMANDYASLLRKPDRALFFKVLDKDLSAGIQVSTANKIFPGLIEEFSVQLAKPYEEKRVEAWPVAVEPKLDGMRLITIVDMFSKEVSVVTRTGKPVESLTNFVSDLLRFASCFALKGTVVIDGEVTAGSNFNESMSVRSKEAVEDPIYHVFDVLISPNIDSPLKSDLAKQGTQEERRERLVAGYKSFKELSGEKLSDFIKVVPSVYASSTDEIIGFFADMRALGYEGAIVKQQSHPYSKKRSYSWMKLKPQETEDVPVIGGFEGAGKYVGMLGGFIVDNNGIQDRIGGGFSDKQRAEFWETLQSDMKLIEEDRRDECVLIDCPIEVEFHERYPSGAFRHGRFVRLRRDKTAEFSGAF